VNATETAAFRAAAGKPFSIGMAPISPDDWIEVDALHAEQCALKAQILAREGKEAFDALPGSEPAQAEAADRLAAHLRRRFPQIPTPLAADEPRLKAISRCVQEDLLLMGREPGGWTLIAGSLCFPTTWRLSEKIGRPMAAIHAPVPGFAGPMGERIHRIFDHLRAEAPVERHNLSIFADAELRHETTKTFKDRFPDDAPILSQAHLRVERQTLTRLPETDALLFTVRIHLMRLARTPARLKALVHAHVSAMKDEELVYKGLRGSRERLLSALQAGQTARV
jgi:hypothetical protein